MRRFAICDDTAMEADFLAESLGLLCPGCHITRYADGEALAAALARGEDFDLLFLDIILPGQDGIALARQLAAEGLLPSTVFLSNSDEYGAEAGALGAATLQKPVGRAALAALLQALPPPAAGPAAAQPLPGCGGHTVVPGDIVALRRSWGRPVLWLAGGRRLRCGTGRRGWAAAAAQLLARRGFAAAGRAWVVNLAFVIGVTKSTALLEGGARLPLARRYRKSFAAAYMAWLAGAK